MAKSCGLEEFRKWNTPFFEEYYPELDESEFISEDKITIYKSLLGSANWIITLGRFDIAYAVNVLSRYTMKPREGHYLALQRVFGYLRQRPHGKILIDVNEVPVREKLDLNGKADWSEFYPDACEDLPLNRPKPKGKTMTITSFVDADHARDKITRRSVTGIVTLLNSTPID